MLTQFIRVLNSVDDTVTDLSMANAEREGILWDFDYLYVAQKFPFNSLFLQMSSVNALSSGPMTVEHWDGSEWCDGVDVLDFTRGLKRSGQIQFAMAKNAQWQIVDDTASDASENCPEELKGINIDCCYWLRIKLDSAPSQPDEDADPEPFPGTVINRVSYAFTSSDKINGIDTDAPGWYDQLKSGKTDWVEEILASSEMMVEEMKSAGLIKAAGQLILLDGISLACANRTLEQIYFNMGKAYDAKRAIVSAAYTSFLSGVMTIDKDHDGRVEQKEIATSQGRLTR